MKACEAIKIAELIKAQLAPMCERIEIAGSIRRGRPEVNDIDLVILPKPGQLDAIKARCEKKCAVVQDGPQNYIVRMPNGFQLDIFFARAQQRDLLQTVPGNWGSLLLLRTGSRAHNIYLLEHSKSLGLPWSPQEGVKDGDGYVIASETEEDIFEALNLPFIEPERRERP